MNVAIYCGKWILPAKNGTRYLDRIFPTTGEEQGNSNNLFKNKKIKSVIDSNELYMLADADVTHLFIREPASQLESALYTDLWGHLMPEERKIGLTKDNNKIINLLTSYTSTGTGHWCHNLYQSLYWLLKRKRDIRVLPLSELTPFMESMGYYEKYNPTDYNFINPTADDKISGVVNITRGELFKWLAKNYPNHINNLVKLLMVEILYYNKIMNEDYGPELPKVKMLSIKKISTKSSYNKITNEDYKGTLPKIQKKFI